jgi:hypothetical protein
LNTNNQISIQYNSAAQKTTADLDYTNKSNGVQVSATGDITYTTPGGYASVGLDAPNADDRLKIVYTTTNPNPDPLNPAFSPLDSVSLSSADGKNVFTGAQIDAIAISSVNTNFAIPLDVTVADKVNRILLVCFGKDNMLEARAKNKENMDRIRRRMQFLENYGGNSNPEAKYKAGPGGAAERIGSPSYKSPSNNLVRKEARIVRTYPKRY